MSSRKITDLERLTQPGGKVLPDDESIPVLTERLSLPSLELDISLPDARAADAVDAPPSDEAPSDTEWPAAAPEPTRSTADEATDAAPEAEPEADTVLPVSGTGDADVDWAEVEERAREALLRELQPRLASELDRSLRERLQPTLVRMLLATVTELRPSIEAAVREAVARAVEAEIARQRAAR